MAQINAQEQGVAGLFVVGPLRRGGAWEFLCPVCDSESLDNVDVTTAECTTAWLHGQELAYDDREWVCFEGDPFDGENLPEKSKRFTYYSAIARALGVSGRGRRVKLPDCVYKKISSLYGQSETGFKEAGGTS